MEEITCTHPEQDFRLLDAGEPRDVCWACAIQCLTLSGRGIATVTIVVTEPIRPAVPR